MVGRKAEPPGGKTESLGGKTEPLRGKNGGPSRFSVGAKLVFAPCRKLGERKVRPYMRGKAGRLEGGKAERPVQPLRLAAQRFSLAAVLRC